MPGVRGRGELSTRPRRRGAHEHGEVSNAPDLRPNLKMMYAASSRTSRQGNLAGRPLRAGGRGRGRSDFCFPPRRTNENIGRKHLTGCNQRVTNWSTHPQPAGRVPVNPPANYRYFRPATVDYKSQFVKCTHGPKLNSPEPGVPGAAQGKVAFCVADPETNALDKTRFINAARNLK